MPRYGLLSISDSDVFYVPGTVDAAVPPGPWSFPISDLRRIVEKTFPAGPVFDYFLVFTAGTRDFAVPLEAFEQEGVDPILAKLGERLGHDLILGLYNRTDLAERLVFEHV